MKNKFLRLFLTAINLAITAVTSTALYYSAALPDSYYVTKGSGLTLSTPIEITCSPVSSDKARAVSFSPSSAQTVCDLSELKLFGCVPIKTVSVRTTDRTVLVAGGSPFGIKMLTEGVMVVGIEGVDGVSPAADAGVRVGDVITKVNGRTVSSNADVRKAVNASGGKGIRVSFLRDGYSHEAALVPVYAEASGEYKAGMYVRDSSAGIGTITYYNPADKSFGGLGHPICDSDTGKIMPMSSGEVVSVSISGAARSSSGAPGELIGSFVTGLPIGRLERNCECGLFGYLDAPPSLSSPIPVALPHEIHTGSAVIFTTINGTSPKAYSIEIEKIDLSRDAGTRSMVIRVTDPELLSRTGGIVQGMSGSPIIQDGMLAGAVTHVFINTPEKGYGIFCDSMLSAAP